ncbi:MAG: calcium-translocating P-type ATPase, PMCA-type [Clostridia bacterium]|nr:calcium-translocating P-type ATPase, PMCA-type [Clostridia bacterium]
MRITDRKQKQCIKGLTSEEAVRAREAHGSNRLSETKTRSFLSHFFGNLNDPVIRILLIALGINLFFVFRGGDIIETLGIGISVLLATLISTLSERGSEAAFRRLSEEWGAGSVRVWRDGSLRKLPLEELVVGDRVVLGAGDQIPADGNMVEGFIRVDQSSLTGESREIAKRPAPVSSLSPEQEGAVLRGCPILSGEGEMEVLAVGDHTLLGRISEEIRCETRESPLRLRLSRLARQISRFGYCAACLCAIAYLFNIFVLDSAFEPAVILSRLRDTPYLLHHLLRALMLGLTVVVMSVPEGLPMMIAVVLSSNMRRMIRDRVLVRKPVGIEAAGSMDLLFTDKTGTLTEGKMSVTRLLLADGTECASSEELTRLSPLLFRMYDRSCRHNTCASLGEDGILGGNATERALLESVGASAPEGAVSVIRKIPFDSAKKYSAAEIFTSRRTVLIKGAPERLLPYLRYAYQKNGSADSFAPFSYAFRTRLSEWTRQGARVLLLAEGDRLPFNGDFGDLTLIGAVSLSDRIRPEAADSVRILKGAGIQTVMITGDHPETARSIAEQCGILCAAHPLLLSSSELNRLSDKELIACLPRLSVVARALPSDKSRLVRLAQEAGRVVGMTGDGVNDAPALKRSDVGFAMGSGTSVAKDAGDIIILDNNLSSITRAVLYGRTIFKSIRKFITLQLTMNFCAVGVSMIGPFIGFDAPVTITQMLWINLIMDTLGGLAFAGEAPSPRFMKEKPKKREEPILNGYMLHQIVFLGGFTVALCTGFLLMPAIRARFRAAPDHIYLLTAFFVLFIFTSVFNCFHARSDRLRLFAGISKNKPFLLIMSAICLLQILFVYLGGSVLRTVPLTAAELLFTLDLSLLVFPAEFLRKLLWRLGGHRDGF